MGLGMILVLENDVDTFDTIMIILTNAGFSTRATKADRVLLDVATIEPDLLILDHNPEAVTTGSGICQAIRSSVHVASLPILLVSASHQLEEHAHAWNATAYISKPFDNTDFCNTVKDILSI